MICFFFFFKTIGDVSGHPHFDFTRASVLGNMEKLLTAIDPSHLMVHTCYIPIEHALVFIQSIPIFWWCYITFQEFSENHQYFLFHAENCCLQTWQSTHCFSQSTPHVLPRKFPLNPPRRWLPWVPDFSLQDSPERNDQPKTNQHSKVQTIRRVPRVTCQVYSMILLL